MRQSEYQERVEINIDFSILSLRKFRKIPFAQVMSKRVSEFRIFLEIVNKRSANHEA